MDLELTPLEKKTLEVFLRGLKACLGSNLQRAILFGSRSRGEGDETSDVDVLVLVNNLTLAVKHQVWDLATDLFLETEINISPLVMTEKQFQSLRERERLIAREIEKSGIAL